MIPASKLWPFGKKPFGRHQVVLDRPSTAAAARILGVTERTPSEGAKVATQTLDASLSITPATGADADLVAETDAAELAEDVRQTARFVPRYPNTTVTDGKGKQHRARIINLSSTGVAVEADFKQVDGRTVTHVGATKVKPGRKIAHGMVFIYEKPLDPTRCGENTTL